MKRAAAALVIVLLAGCDPAPPGPPGVGTKALPPARLRVQQILIAFRGAKDALPRVSRTREEAEVLAKRILERARQGEDFKKLIQENTDDDGKKEIGMVSAGTRPRGDERRREGFDKGLADVAFGLAVGEAGMAPYDPRDAPTGFHIIKRTQ